MSATAFYVIVYTMVLKRRSRQNIVIGGAAGAVPVLVGWAAVTNSLGWTPVLLFLVIFIWTPPHFWALAVRYRDDYEAANVPMMPVVASLRRTTLEILIYSVAAVGADAADRPERAPGLGLRRFGDGARRDCSPSTPLRLYRARAQRQGRRRRGDATLPLLHHVSLGALYLDGG